MKRVFLKFFLNFFSIKLFQSFWILARFNQVQTGYYCLSSMLYHKRDIREIKNIMRAHHIVYAHMCFEKKISFK